MGEVTRLSWEPQLSGHSAFAKPETNAGVLLWTFQRLGIVPAQAAALLDNHLSRVTLWTDPQWREALFQLRRFVLDPLFKSAQRPDIIPEVRAGLYF